MENETSFIDLNLIPEIQHAIEKKGYKVPTPIQLKSIPSLLKGKDLIGIAQTGTGKTAAFILPILNRMIEQYPRKIKTLVLAPTRELAAQIGESFHDYGKFLKFKHTVIFGGVGQGAQVKALSKGVDILVATPGRLLDLMNQRKLSLRDVDFFVLDEADRMLDMGFIHDIKKVISKLPDHRQSLFFSATMSPAINALAKSLLSNPVHVEVAAQATTVEKIKQFMFFVNQQDKEKLLLNLLNQEHLTSVLVFTRTKHRANKLAQFLTKNHINSDAIHGNKSQTARTKAIRNFKDGRTKVLVATDIAARGIDIDKISHVINFELPNEPESYVHRIGRTARAGEDGTAYSFCEATERNYLRDIEKLIRQKIQVMDHEFHSESAKNATGLAAKPAPRKQFSRQRRPSRQSGDRKFSRDRKPSRKKNESGNKNYSKGKKPKYEKSDSGKGSKYKKPNKSFSKKKKFNKSRYTKKP